MSNQSLADIQQLPNIGYYSFWIITSTSINCPLLICLFKIICCINNNNTKNKQTQQQFISHRSLCVSTCKFWQGGKSRDYVEQDQVSLANLPFLHYDPLKQATRLQTLRQYMGCLTLRLSKRYRWMKELTPEWLLLCSLSLHLAISIHHSEPLFENSDNTIICVWCGIVE